MAVAAVPRIAPALLAASIPWFVVVLTRLLTERLHLQQFAFTSDQVMHRAAGATLRGARPGLNQRVRVDDHHQLTTASIAVTTDRHGWREEGRTLGASSIVAFGDGFAFGLGVADNNLFTRHTGTTTKSIGAPGRSMVDTVLQMEERIQDLRDRTLVWLVYLGNDLTDNLRPFLGTTPVPYARCREGAWDVVTRHVKVDAAPLEARRRNYLADLATICSDTPESAKALGAADYLLARASRLCEESGARLIVMTVPRRAQLHRRDRVQLRTLSPDPASFDVRRPDMQLEATCARLGVTFVPLLDHLDARDYQPGDRLHWRRSGHRKVGVLIGSVHRELTEAPGG